MQQPIGGYGGAAPAYAPPVGRRVAILLPLTGSNASLGQAMLQAARLAFDPDRPDALDTRDTKGTPAGAAAAASAAIAAGAGLIVGPLTAPETEAVAPIATAQHVPVLALTSDGRAAQPGVWPLGLTPAQQVRTLVRATVRDGKRRIGAILPSNPFGESLAAGLQAATAEMSLPPPVVLRYQNQAGLENAITQMGRSAPVPGAPAPIEALLLGSTADATLRMLPALTAAGLGPDRIRLLGTALWSRDAAKLGALSGALFAAPPADSLHVFEGNYAAHYGSPPRDIASVAFDAAAAARAASGPNGISVATLLNPAGFAGANGVFQLLPDGTVRRSLAIVEVGAGGPRQTTAPGM